MASGSIVQRAIGTAFFNKDVIEEIEHNAELNTEAVTVVAVASAAEGIGLLLADAIGPEGFQPVRALGRLAFAIIAGIAVYYLMAFFIHYFGKGFFGAQGGVDQVRRTVGFAYGPKALGLLAFVPAIGGWLPTVGWIWFLLAAFVASRQALDISNGKTALTVGIAVFAGFLIVGFFAFMLGIAYLPFIT